MVLLLTLTRGESLDKLLTPALQVGDQRVLLFGHEDHRRPLFGVGRLFVAVANALMKFAVRFPELLEVLVHKPEFILELGI